MAQKSENPVVVVFKSHDLLWMKKKIQVIRSEWNFSLSTILFYFILVMYQIYCCRTGNVGSVGRDRSQVIRWTLLKFCISHLFVVTSHTCTEAHSPVLHRTQARAAQPAEQSHRGRDGFPSHRHRRQLLGQVSGLVSGWFYIALLNCLVSCVWRSFIFVNMFLT